MSKTPDITRYFANAPKDLGVILAEPIVEYLQDHDQLSSDDVYEQLLSLARFHRPNSDQRIIGLGFQHLARKGVIKRVGYRNSRLESCHHRQISIWRLTDGAHSVSSDQLESSTRLVKSNGGL